MSFAANSERDIKYLTQEESGAKLVKIKEREAYRIDIGRPHEIAGLHFVTLIAQDPTTGLYFFLSEIFISRGRYGNFLLILDFFFYIFYLQ